MASGSTTCSDLISSGALLKGLPGFRLELGEKSGAVLMILCDHQFFRMRRMC
jgi:hypothetical protein